MRFPSPSLRVASAILFLICVAGAYAQNETPGGMVPRYTKKAPVDISTVRPFTEDTILSVKPALPSVDAGAHLLSGPIANASTSTGANSNISGLITVPTFAGAFAAQKGPTTDDPFPAGTVFPFIMMGNDPLVGGTTTIPAKITEVSLVLLNADGTTFKTVPFTTTFEDVVTDSPNFANFTYTSSSIPTQYADAIQRAEFFKTAMSSWHTLLGGPTIVNHIKYTIPKTVNVQFADGTIEAVTSYFTATAADGSTVVFLLDLLFDLDFSNAVVNDINAGHFTTNALNLELLPNTSLFSANEAHPNTPGACCVLGFHTYFFANVTPQPRVLTAFSSYLSPGVFSPFADVSGMSHEISESFNDPFDNNPTPVWQFPGQPATSTVCQNNLETGDPIEGLSNPVFPIKLTEGTTSITFHPQTEALLQWFEMGATSNAINGAFSFPNTSVLTKSATPCP